MKTPHLCDLTTHFPLDEITSRFGEKFKIAYSSTQASNFSYTKESSTLVILVVFNDDVKNDLVTLEKAISHGRNFLWLALLEHDDCDNEHYLGILARYFYDYHSYPIDIKRIYFSIGHALGMAKLKKNEYQHMCHSPSTSLLLGNSSAILSLREQIRRLACCRLPIMITGPSGSGKELVARELHATSLGCSQPFIAINCGAIPTQLIQSELFGHVKGAFTGAIENKKGKVEAANNGTLFLDEIGELSLESQVVLLRFLQEGTIDSVGCNKPIKVNVRVIAATNIDIEKNVAEGKFREDLYYRLNVIRLHTPALNQRKEDILILANHFISELDSRTKFSFSIEAKKVLSNYNWPGNVRELRNRVLRATALCDSSIIDCHDLDLPLAYALNDNVESLTETLKSTRLTAERQLLVRMQAQHHDNIDEIAQRLDISRATLYRLLQKHDMHKT